MAKPTLDALRAIFREEFDDLLHVLGRQADRAERGLSAEATAAADAEVRRAVHTLKGASRAVGYAALEAECHRLETTLEKRRGAAPPSAAQVVADAREAITIASRFTSLVHGEPPPSDPAPSERLTATVWVEEEELAEVAPRKALTSLEATSPVAPARTAASAHETVRVDAVALASILDASENLVLEMSRGAPRTTHHTIEATTADLLRELDHVRRLAAAFEGTSRSHGASELKRRLDRAFGSARTLAAATEARATLETTAWAGASARAKKMAGAARSLRQDRFEVLAAAAAQAARDHASETAVAVRVVRSGEDVRFDRRLREPLREILLHLVRNAIAHGLEPAKERSAAGKPEVGVLSVTAEEGEGELRIIVSDDGRGIDVEAVERRARELGIEGPALEVLFAAGLSTKATADELAGRGIGLDVVRQRVIDLHGRISVETQRGQGTTFRIAVAPDLSLIRAVLARAGVFSVAIRLSAIERIVRTPRAELRVASGRTHLLYEGALVPLANVSSELGASAAMLPSAATLTLVVIAAGDRRVALVVDELLDEREIAVRPLQGRLRVVPFVSGTTILPDGDLGWVLDARSLAASARGVLHEEEGAKRAAKRVLVVDDSATTRELERTLLRAAGFEVEAVADGEQAWSALSGDMPFDVVLSDVEMPRLDGFSLLGRIRATPRLAQLPVVLVTGLEDLSDKQRALDMGASAYIVKSAFDEDQLLAVIAHLL